MLLIKNGTLIDPKSHIEGKYDILTEDKKIIKISENIDAKDYKDAEVIDASGAYVVPGLMDVHVHFRDPGFTHKEDIFTGANAAKKGGFTTVVMMANTKPAIDNLETLAYVTEKAAQADLHVLASADISMGMEGKEVVDMKTLYEAGAVGFTDDGLPLMDEAVLVEAMRASKELKAPLSFHEEDPEYIGKSGFNNGKASEHFGFKGADRKAETVMIERDIKLALNEGAICDFQHISAKESVDVIYNAKKELLKDADLHNITSDITGVSKEMTQFTSEQTRSINIHAEATPNHFSLTEDDVIKHGALAKINPPIREEADRLAIIEGLKTGAIDLIVTDHAPHTMEEKSVEPIYKAPSGMIGLETSLALGVTNLVKAGHLTYMEMLEKMTINPASMYGVDAGYIAEGGPADITIFNEDEIVAGNYASKACNTPFTGMKLNGKVLYTICDGKIIYKAN